MKLTRSSVGWTLGVAALTFGALILGTLVGAKYERDRFQLAKDFAPTLAAEDLARGDFDKALRALHFAKSFEPRIGFTDAALGNAYLAKGQPCLAQAFLESGLEWMTREKLTDEIRVYSSAKQALPNAAAQCSEIRRSSIPR
jgi:hypothetical protein